MADSDDESPTRIQVHLLAGTGYSCTDAAPPALGSALAHQNCVKQLTGTNANVAVTERQAGNQLSGSFRLVFKTSLIVFS